MPDNTRLKLGSIMEPRSSNLPEKLSDDRGDPEPGLNQWIGYGQMGGFMSRNKIHYESEQSPHTKRKQS